jgi:hypothetical protein
MGKGFPVHRMRGDVRSGSRVRGIHSSDRSIHGNSSSVTWTGFLAIHPPSADKMMYRRTLMIETTDESINQSHPVCLTRVHLKCRQIKIAPLYIKI